jgi:lysophospholipase L1-like esterase
MLRLGVFWLGCLLKWLLIGVVCIEVCSFLIISISNLILYGHLREGSRAVYDPYTLFLQSPAVRPTVGNASASVGSDNRTIWMFGGSTMRGATDDDSHTIASYLATYLNSGDRRLRFQVVNFGINSFNSLLEIKYLEKALIQMTPQPDLIIFYDGANDTKYFVEHRTADAHYGYRRVRALIEGYYGSWIGLFKPITAAIQASFTRELYDKLHQVALPLDPGSPELRAMVKEAGRRYDFAEKLVRGLNGQFLLVWQPMLWTEGCPVSPAVAAAERTMLVNSDRLAPMRRNFTTTYQALTERLASEPYFVDLSTVVCGRSVPAYQPDGVHMTDDGRRAVAKAIGDVISRRFFAKPN